ncbi:18737_t:CDS:2, partial [Funneliformis geosporum]
QIILNLQINPPGNIATLPDVLNPMASLFAICVVAFNNGVKTNVLAGKMAGRFTPPNPFNNSARIVVATP